MAHQHSVYDTDPHFKIDSFSRAITDLSEKQIKLMQGDHNSERFTFEIDRRVDGHDMTQCDRVEVHYLNVDGSTKESFGDVYEVDDMSTSPVSDNVVIFSWLVSKNATGFAGTLNFRIRFVCTDETGNVVYAWHTDIFKGITVSSGISNTAAAVEEYSDVLAKWQRDLFEQGSTSVANVNVAREAAISAVQDEGAAQIAAVEAKGAATLESIPNDFSAVAAEAEANTAAIVEVDEHRAALESRTTRQAKLIKNLSQAIQNTNDGITPDPYDSAPAFKWSVPENALPFAKIREIGGMTYKEGDVLRSAPTSEVVSEGVNLFDVDKRECGTIDDDGNLYITNLVSDFYRFDAEENTQYTLSAYVKNINTTGSGRLSVVYTDGSVDEVVLLNPNTEWAYHSFTTATGKTVALIRTNFGDSGAWYIRGAELMLNKGTTALPYRPFIKRTLAIPEAVRNLPDYGVGIPNTDYFNRIRWRYDEQTDKWVREYEKQAGKAIFNGTENFFAWTNGGTFLGLMLEGVNYDYSNGSDLRGICSHYDVGVGGTFGINSVRFRQQGDVARWYFYDNTLTSVEAWVNRLAELYAAGNPLTVVYKLAEPEITDISDLLPEDNLIGVEAGGTITAENEFGYAVPMIIK